MKTRNRIDEARHRAVILVGERLDGLEENKGIIPEGQKKPTPEQLRTAVDALYPPIDFVTKDGNVIENVSPLVLLVLVKGDAVKDGRQFLKEYAKGGE